MLLQQRPQVLFTRFHVFCKSFSPTLKKKTSQTSSFVKQIKSNANTYVLENNTVFGCPGFVSISSSKSLKISNLTASEALLSQTSKFNSYIQVHVLGGSVDVTNSVFSKMNLQVLTFNSQKGGSAFRLKTLLLEDVTCKYSINFATLNDTISINNCALQNTGQLYLQSRANVIPSVDISNSLFGNNSGIAAYFPLSLSNSTFTNSNGLLLSFTENTSSATFSFSTLRSSL